MRRKKTNITHLQHRMINFIIRPMLLGGVENLMERRKIEFAVEISRSVLCADMSNSLSNTSFASKDVKGKLIYLSVAHQSFLRATFISLTYYSFNLTEMFFLVGFRFVERHSV